MNCGTQSTTWCYHLRQFSGLTTRNSYRVSCCNVVGGDCLFPGLTSVAVVAQGEAATAPCGLEPVAALLRSPQVSDCVKLAICSIVVTEALALAR